MSKVQITDLQIIHRAVSLICNFNQTPHICTMMQ